jgi:hypothetical protein
VIFDRRDHGNTYMKRGRSDVEDFCGGVDSCGFYCNMGNFAKELLVCALRNHDRRMVLELRVIEI